MKEVYVVRHVNHPQGQLQIARMSMWLFAAAFSVMTWLAALFVLRDAL